MFPIPPLHVRFDLGIAVRVKVFEAEVFQLLLDTLHTEPVGKRGVDVHSFQRGDPLFFGRFCVQRAHIVQSVAELDKNDPDVLGHGEQHLAQGLDMRFFFILGLKRHDFGQPVHQQRHVNAETLLQFFQAGFVGAVLHRVVQERRADRVRIQPQRGNDFCHGKRMGDIRLPALTKLPVVHLTGVLVCLGNFFDIIVTAG